MKQNSKVIVVLVAVVVAFVATTLGGLRWSDERDEQAENDLETKGPPDWLTTVGSALPSPMPSIDLSTATVVGGTREDDVVLVEDTPVTIGAPPSDEDFRRADLRLVSGPPVGVRVTDDGMNADAQQKSTPGSGEDARKGKQKVRVIVSGKGGTIVLRRPPLPKEGDIVLTGQPQDDDTVLTSEPMDGNVSRVRFE